MHLQEDAIKNIIRKLAQVQSEVQLFNGIQLYDINTNAEDFFRVLLNKVYGFNLRTLAFTEFLSPAIDLADDEQQIAIQVTSTADKRKYDDTLAKFRSHGYCSKYKTLKILLLKPKKNHKPILFEEGEFSFNSTLDVLDFSLLINDIRKLDTEKIVAISDWLTSEFQYSPPNTSSIPQQQDLNRYFNTFLEDGADVRDLLLRAQPTLSDCKAVFGDEYYKMIYSIYSAMYHSILEQDWKLNDILADKEEFIAQSSTYADLDTDTKLAGGMRDKRVVAALRPGKLSYYQIRFKRKDAEFGFTFKIWVYIRGRWVFFPKPWHIVLTLDAMKKSRILRIILRGLKAIGWKTSGDRAHGVMETLFIMQELSRK